MDPATLSQTLGVLRDTYQGIDIRALLAKAEGGWTCAFLKIRPTSEGRTDVEQKYAKINQDLGEIKNDKVRVEFEYRPIAELDASLSEVQNNTVTINGTSATLKSTAQNIQNNKTQEDDDFSNANERSGFPDVFLNNPMDMTTRSYLKSLGIANIDKGRNFEELYSYFDVRNLDSSSSVVVVLPVYCKKIEVLFDDKKTVLSRYEIHKALLDKLSARVIVKTAGVAEYTLKPSLSPKTTESNGMCQVDIPMLQRPVTSNSQVSVEIQNDILGKVAVETIKAEDLKEILRHDDQLIAVISMFELSKNLSPSLSSTKEFPQLASTIIVLSLLGFRCVPLGITDKSHEKIMEAKVEKGSADILAYSQELKLMLVIDCTTTIPDDTKLGLIGNTAIHITKTLGTDVIPAVVSAVDSSSASAKAKALHILLMDTRCTEQLARLVLSGQKDAGITLLRGYIQNAI